MSYVDIGINWDLAEAVIASIVQRGVASISASSFSPRPLSPLMPPSFLNSSFAAVVFQALNPTSSFFTITSIRVPSVRLLDRSNADEHRLNIDDRAESDLIFPVGTPALERTRASVHFLDHGAPSSGADPALVFTSSTRPYRSPAIRVQIELDAQSATVNANGSPLAPTGSIGTQALVVDVLIDTAIMSKTGVRGRAEYETVLVAHIGQVFYLNEMTGGWTKLAPDFNAAFLRFLPMMLSSGLSRAIADLRSAMISNLIDPLILLGRPSTNIGSLSNVHNELHAVVRLDGFLAAEFSDRTVSNAALVVAASPSGVRQLLLRLQVEDREFWHNSTIGGRFDALPANFESHREIVSSIVLHQWREFFDTPPPVPFAPGRSVGVRVNLATFYERINGAINDALFAPMSVSPDRAPTDAGPLRTVFESRSFPFRVRVEQPVMLSQRATSSGDILVQASMRVAFLDACLLRDLSISPTVSIVTSLRPDPSDGSTQTILRVAGRLDINPDEVDLLLGCGPILHIAVPILIAVVLLLLPFLVAAAVGFAVGYSTTGAILMAAGDRRRPAIDFGRVVGDVNSAIESAIHGAAEVLSRLRGRIRLPEGAGPFAGEEIEYDANLETLSIGFSLVVRDFGNKLGTWYAGVGTTPTAISTYFPSLSLRSVLASLVATADVSTNSGQPTTEAGSLLIAASAPGPEEFAADAARMERATPQLAAASRTFIIRASAACVLSASVLEWTAFLFNPAELPLAVSQIVILPSQLANLVQFSVTGVPSPASGFSVPRGSTIALRFRVSAVALARSPNFDAVISAPLRLVITTSRGIVDRTFNNVFGEANTEALSQLRSMLLPLPPPWDNGRAAEEWVTRWEEACRASQRNELVATGAATPVREPLFVGEIILDDDMVRRILFPIPPDPPIPAVGSKLAMSVLDEALLVGQATADPFATALAVRRGSDVRAKGGERLSPADIIGALMRDLKEGNVNRH